MKMKFFILAVLMTFSGISTAAIITCNGSDDSNNSFSVAVMIDEDPALSFVEVYKNGNLTLKIMGREECATVLLQSFGPQTNINAVRMPHCDREPSSNYDLLQLVIEPGSRPDYNTRGVFQTVEDSRAALLFLNCL